ncbi:MAG: hypothetical protein HY272_00305 [Gammaproteobacteria bacterium]|nr:hypothetical protein [Gammaproteobacteria bacterium]
MAINFEDILEAFEFVSFAQVGECQAFLDKETGKIYWHSDFGGDFEELPEDIADKKYIELPHKNELDIGKRLIFDFAYQYLPDDAGEIESIFRMKGAYSKFKALLERRDFLDKWHEFESQAGEKALRKWCEENSIEVCG